MYLPSEVRNALGLRAGDRLRVEIVDGKIILVPEKRIKKLRRGCAWGSEAFLDAGEALVSG